MANSNLDKEIDTHRLKTSRPDLWPKFLETLKEQAPDYFNLIHSENVNALHEKYGGKFLLRIGDLPEKAQFMIFVATKQAMGARTDRTKPANIKNKRPDLWPKFLGVLERNDQEKFNQVQNDIDSIIWFVDDLPYFAQIIIDQAISEANTGKKP